MMQKFCLKDFWIIVATSYTIISLGTHLLELVIGWGDIGTHLNAWMMFICTVVSVGVLSLYYRLEDWSPLAVIIFQYVLAISMIMGIYYLMGKIDPIAPVGYFDIWRSFTVIYMIGAAIYYAEVIASVKKQNKWIQEIKEQQERGENTKEKNLD